VESAWNTYVSRRQLVTETLAPMRERADEIARIALAAYREGGIDLLRLLDAERARLEALTAYYQALADYQTSVTQVRIVTGAPL
jgi:outer membrane protein TolC